MATATEQSAQLQRNVSRFLAGVHARTQRRLRQWLPPRGPGRDVAAALAEEVRRSTAFEAAVRARLARDLPKAFAQENPRAAIAMLLARERRYARAHVEAAASRAAHSLERERIRRISPYGALWLLDPTIENCAQCILMAGKVWPWEVIDAEPPPLHHRCGCYLKPAPVFVPEVNPVGPGEDGEPDDLPPPIVPPPRDLVVTYADRAAEQAAVAEDDHWRSQPRDPGGENGGRWIGKGSTGSPAVGEDAWVAALTGEEEDGFRGYQGVGYGAINSYLRTGTSTNPYREASELDEQIGYLDSGIAKGQLDVSTTVYRAMEIDPNVAVGAVVEDPAYMSTSRSEEVIAKFAYFITEKDDEGSGGTPVVAEIRLPSGWRVGFPGRLENMLGEEEVLLPRGQRFRVASAEPGEVTAYDETVPVVKIIMEPVE